MRAFLCVCWFFVVVFFFYKKLFSWTSKKITNKHPRREFLYRAHCRLVVHHFILNVGHIVAILHFPVEWCFYCDSFLLTALVILWMWWVLACKFCLGEKKSLKKKKKTQEEKRKKLSLIWYCGKAIFLPLWWIFAQDYQNSFASAQTWAITGPGDMGAPFPFHEQQSADWGTSLRIRV